MPYLNLKAFRGTALEHDPYDYLVVPGFLERDAVEAVNRDFPQIDSGGLFPVSTLDHGPAMARLLDELDGADFEAAVAEKFALSLEELPTLFLVRGHCAEKDGRIHTDDKNKVITVLIYFNLEWPAAGGRLRVLRGPRDLDDMAAEIAPLAGTLFAFRRSERSWHGHAPYRGERRAIQMNWVRRQRWGNRETIRHRTSAKLKRLNPFS
jgi:hypothetical protein